MATASYGNENLNPLGLSDQFTSNPSFNIASQRQQVTSGMDIFNQQFQNLVGRPPTPQESNDFSNNALYSAWNAPGDLSYSDTSNLVNNYLQNTFSPQIAQNQQQQQQSQLGQTQNTIQNLIQKQVGATASDITNPNSPTYQSFAGNLNNLGITPSSGAFQAGLGGQLGQTASNAINSALGAVSLPAISGIQGLTSLPMNISQNYADLSHLNQLQDFGMQSDLARQLGSQSGPSGFQQGMAGLNTGANVAGGVSSFMKPTWICTAMWRSQVLLASEVDLLHHHLFKMFFRKFLKFLGYFVLGKFVVLQAQRSQVNWEAWRQLFYDRVIAEPDAAKALELYEEAFWRLFKWAFLTTSIQQEIIS